MNQASEVLVSVCASLGDFVKQVSKFSLSSSSESIRNSGRGDFNTSSLDGGTPERKSIKDTKVDKRMAVMSPTISIEKYDRGNDESVLYSQNGFRKGVLDLIRMSDKIYILVFKGLEETEGDTNRSPFLASSDLDEVKFIDEWNSVVLLGEGMLVNVVNKIEYDILKTARDECITISKLTLRLESAARDAFFAGYHSTLHQVRAQAEPTEEELKRSEKAIYSFKNQNKICLKVRDLFQTVTNKSMGMIDTTEEISRLALVPKGGKGGDRKRARWKAAQAAKAAALSQGIAFSAGGKRSRTTSSTRYLHGTIKCVYCEAEKRMPAFNKTDFIEHPYCGLSHDKETIAMCMPCANNWDNYRTNLKSTMGLVLPGEFNEELCAMCSDTPEELLLCSFCPRSFCNTCLARTLKPEMLEQLHKETDADWACQACANGMGAQTALPKSKWRIVTFDAPVDDTRPIPTPWALPLPSASASTSNTALGKSAQSKEFGAVLVMPKKKSGGKSSPATSSSSSSGLPRIAKDMSEERYFAQYVLHTDSIYNNAETSGLHKSEDMYCTDDACFLCKDGGDLIECDWKRNFGSKRGSCRCRKVYHEYCLAYAVPDSKTWICPRHYCDGCASQNLAYMCKYCPVSVCDTCLPSLAATYGNTEYAPLPTPPFGWEDNLNVQVIVCHTCLRMFEKCLKECPDLITPRHPVFAATRHRAAEGLDAIDVDLDGTMFNKSAAPISMPGKSAVHHRRGNQVRKKEEVLDYLKRPGQSKRKRLEVPAFR